MNNIQEILAYNKSFVETKEYEKYTAGKFPTKNGNYHMHGHPSGRTAA